VDWDALPGLRGTTYSWLVGGLFGAGMGVYILQLPNTSIAALVAGAAFFLAGLYLTFTTFSYARTLIELRRTAPTEMLLTITGRESNHKDYYAELRYPDTQPDAHCDIHTHLVHMSELKHILPRTLVKVYGSRETGGPVIIETEFGPVWSSGPSGVNRHVDPR